MVINSGTNYNNDGDDNGEHEHEHDADDIIDNDNDEMIIIKMVIIMIKRYKNVTHSYMKMWKLFLHCIKNSISKCYFTEMIKR